MPSWLFLFDILDELCCAHPLIMGLLDILESVAKGPFKTNARGLLNSAAILCKEAQENGATHRNLPADPQIVISRIETDADLCDLEWFLEDLAFLHPDLVGSKTMRAFYDVKCRESIVYSK